VDVADVIEHAMTNAPRSLQTVIGPSQVGGPCDRKLGHLLDGTPPVKVRPPQFATFVGTAVHEELANTLARAEIARYTSDPHATPRYKVEERVTVGEIDGQPVTGSTDLVDLHALTVYDWKITTRARIRDVYRRHGPGPQYEAQAMLYARGWRAAGIPIQTVCIVFLPRDGQLSERYEWTAPYDAAVADAALARASAIAAALRLVGRDVTLPALARVDDYCRYCEWFTPNADPMTPDACAGANPQANATTEPATVSDLLRVKL
jgi:hypothetical protein